MSLTGELTPPFTLEQLVHTFRQEMDDLPGDIVSEDTAWDNDDSGLLWKNSEIVRYANEAQRELYRRILFTDNATTALTQIAVTADTATYAYDARILGIRRVKYIENGINQMVFSVSSGDFEQGEIVTDDTDPTISAVVTSWNGATQTLQYRLQGATDFSASTGGLTGADSGATATAVAPTVITAEGDEYVLTKQMQEDMDNTIPRWEQYDSGTCEYYVEDENERTITLWRTPELSGTLHLNVWRLPLADLAWKSRHTLIECPVEHQINLIDYMKHSAYKKKDAETERPELAKEHLAMFTLNVGDRPSAHVETLRRRESRSHRRVRAHFL